MDGYPLGAWVKQQRADGTKGRLDEGRERRLKDLPGWAWDAQAAKWEEGFSRLVVYVEDNDDARVPVSYKVDGYPLGGWVHVQRRNYGNGTLDPDRQRRLQKLSGWTWKASSPT
jgi:hypothetical protein